jgi:8-hydroxy-5-deazaflavin:NADPH oxidoreductase
MTAAIIGTGNIGSAVARHLVAGDETVVVAAKDAAHSDALALQLGPRARAASVEDAITAADVVVLALWLDDMRDVIPRYAGVLEGKVVVDPSNPLGFDANGQIIRTLPADQSAGSIVASLLPAGAHYAKAFGTLSAEALASNANRKPRPVVLFYATDSDDAAKSVERLIRAAGFEPFKVGGVAAASRIEMPGGDLHQYGLNGEVVDLDRARAVVDRKEARA